MAEDKRRIYLNFEIINKISKLVDDTKEVTSSSALNFRALFFDSIGSHHMIPCRVCGTFKRVSITFTDAKDPHEAVALCMKHCSQFRVFYSYALGGVVQKNDPKNLCNIGADTIARDLCEFPLSELVVESLIHEDGESFCEDRIIYDEDEYPLTIDLSHCDFFMLKGDRKNTISKISRGWINSNSFLAEHEREMIDRLRRESQRVCGVEIFPFICPWDNMVWR